MNAIKVFNNLIKKLAEFGLNEKDIDDFALDRRDRYVDSDVIYEITIFLHDSLKCDVIKRNYIHIGYIGNYNYRLTEEEYPNGLAFEVTR